MKIRPIVNDVWQWAVEIEPDRRIAIFVLFHNVGGRDEIGAACLDDREQPTIGQGFTVYEAVRNLNEELEKRRLR